MPDLLNTAIAHLKQEWPLIRSVWLSFIICVIVATGVLTFAIYYFVVKTQMATYSSSLEATELTRIQQTEILKDRLAQRDDEISKLRTQIVEYLEQSERQISRRLSASQKNKLANELKKSSWNPDTLAIRYFPGCMECIGYGNDIIDAISRAGWVGEFAPPFFSANTTQKGVLLIVENLAAISSDAKALGSALEKAGISFEWVADSPLSTPVILFIFPGET